MSLFPDVGPEIEEKTRVPRLPDLREIRKNAGGEIFEALDNALAVLEYWEPRSGFLTHAETSALRTATRLFLRGEPSSSADIAHGMYERSRELLQEVGILDPELSETIEV